MNRKQIKLIASLEKIPNATREFESKGYKFHRVFAPFVILPPTPLPPRIKRQVIFLIGKPLIVQGRSRFPVTYRQSIECRNNETSCVKEEKRGNNSLK